MRSSTELLMEIMCRQKSCPGFLTSLERGYFFVSGPTVYSPHQPPSPASAENAPRFSATAVRLAARGSRLPAGLGTTSSRCSSEGAAKTERKRATAPQRHLFQGNTLSRAKGGRAEVSGAFFISRFKRGSSAAAARPPQPSPPRNLPTPPSESESPLFSPG